MLEYIVKDTLALQESQLNSYNKPPLTLDVITSAALSRRAQHTRWQYIADLYRVFDKQQQTV